MPFLKQHAEEQKLKKQLEPILKHADKGELPTMLASAHSSKGKEIVKKNLAAALGIQMNTPDVSLVPAHKPKQELPTKLVPAHKPKAEIKEAFKSATKEISTITGKPLPTHEEKFAASKTAIKAAKVAGDYLKGNLMSRPPEGKFLDREKGEEGIWAEPELNWEMAEVVGPVKKLISPIFKKFFPKTVKNAEKIADAMPRQKLPKYAAAVNLQRQKIPKDLKLAELRVSEDVVKPKTRWAKIDKESGKILNDPKKLQGVLEKAKQGTSLNPVETDVIRKSNVEGLYKFQADMEAAGSSQEAALIFGKYKDEIFTPTSHAATQPARHLMFIRRK